jgi:hypothetical protein
MWVTFGRETSEVEVVVEKFPLPDSTDCHEPEDLRKTSHEPGALPVRAWTISILETVAD